MNNPIYLTQKVPVLEYGSGAPLNSEKTAKRGAPGALHLRGALLPRGALYDLPWVPLMKLEGR